MSVGSVVLALGGTIELRGAAADTESADKNQYTLFHPTPDSLLREFTPDRPDKTESPFTVDAGHFQVEMDLVAFTYDRYNPARTDVRSESFGLFTANLKLGLCNQADFELIVPTWNTLRVEDRVAKSVQKNSGFGALMTRLKVNFFGNDGGNTALGAIAFARYPTSEKNLGPNSMEGGIIFPLSIKLPHEWELGAMTEVDVTENIFGKGHHAEFINSITFAHKIFGPLDGYAEFFSAISAEKHSPWVGTIDFGLTYALAENVQLDAGINIGLTRSADDLNPFVGIAFRF